MTLWWLSFARPAGHAGVALVDAPDGLEAVRESIRRDCNPGPDTAVAMSPLPDRPRPDPAWLNRLLTTDEAVALDELMAQREVGRTPQ